MTDAEHMAAYARQHFADDLGGASTAEEIARALVARSTGGPRHWCGVRILKSLGLFADGSALPH